MPLEKDIQELTKAIRELIALSQPPACKDPVPSEQEKDISDEMLRDARKKTEDLISGRIQMVDDVETVVMKDAVSYDDVKAVVLNVAKTKGRDASLDLLTPFGVVTGKGETRVGSITKLKPEQYEGVIIAAKKVLG